MSFSLAELILLALLVLNLLLLLWLALRRPNNEAFRAAFEQAQGQQGRDAERLERELRNEVQGSARNTRSELTQGLSLFQQALLAQSGDVARTQNEQIDSFRVQLSAMQQQVAQTLQSTTEVLTRQSQAGAEALSAALMQAREAQDIALKRLADGLGEQIKALAEGNERRLGEV
nr:hypothetical protein [Vitreoscilla sp.]